MWNKGLDKFTQVLVANKRFEAYRDVLKQEKAFLLDGERNASPHYDYNFMEKVLIKEWGADKLSRIGYPSNKKFKDVVAERLGKIKDDIQDCKRFIKANKKVFQILEDERMLQEEDTVSLESSEAVTRAIKESLSNYPRLNAMEHSEAVTQVIKGSDYPRLKKKD